MAKKQTKKSDKGKAGLPAWDLSDLYRGIDDPNVGRTLKAAVSRADDFARRYRGRISPDSGADFLAGALKEYEAILQEAAKPEVYAHLMFSADTADQKHGAFLQKMKSEATAIFQKLVFFELELVHLPESVFKFLVESSTLLNYRHYLANLLAWKPHRLSEAEEKIFNDKNLTGREAWSRFFDQELSAKEFVVKKGRAEKKMGEEEVLNMLYSKDRDERKAGAQALTRGLKEESRRLTYVFNILAEDKAINDRYMKFPSPESARHLANEIDQDTVDAMTSAVAEAYDIVADFYDFKRKALGLKKLYDYDRYAPVGGAGKKFSFAEAKNITLDSFRAFSPVYADTARKFFDKKWIDADLRKGKRSGAFCSFVSPDVHPFVFMNYKNNVQSVKTLAHELGHGIHAYLMRSQSYLNYSPPLTMCETSSVFGEMLVFSHLRGLLGKKEKFSLYVKKVEDAFATVFRQTAMYKFEQDLHAARRAKGELSPDEISALWRKRQKEMFKGSVELTPDYDIWWSYIPHFVHSPFYVYAYAFGELLTLSLWARYQKDGKDFVEKYIDMLSAGSSRPPRELLAPFGIDLADKKFWREGVAVIRDLVKETELLL